MKTVWNVEMRTMNGTVTMMTETSAFTDRNVAEAAAAAIREKNKNADLVVYTRVYESKLYETLEEVPILNQ